jgi:large subunit ribosomal protein L29
MKAADLRDKSPEELQVEADQLAAKVYELRSARVLSDKVGAPHELRAAKKDRARVLTVLREKKLLKEAEVDESEK